MDKIKSSMQTEATMLTNISQHCWMLHVTLNPAAFRHLVTCSCVLLRVAACCSCAFLRVVACRCLLLLRVPACCWELLLKVWNRLNFWSNDSHHFFSFFFSFMIVEAGCFLELRKPLLIHFCVGDVGIVQHLFNLLYYVCYTTTWEISANWLA